MVTSSNEVDSRDVEWWATHCVDIGWRDDAPSSGEPVALTRRELESRSVESQRRFWSESPGDPVAGVQAAPLRRLDRPPKKVARS